MKTITKTLYEFDDLDEDAKETARAWWREGILEHDFWYECAIEDAKELGKLLGIEIENVYFSGFWNHFHHPRSFSMGF